MCLKEMLSFRRKILKISLILLTACSTTTVIFRLLRIPSSSVLAVLQFSVIIAFMATMLNLSAKLSIHVSTPNGSILMTLLTTSTLLLISVALQLHSPITAGLSLFVSSLLPGYIILRLTSINPKSHVETVLLSYALSLPITAIIGTIVFLHVGEGFRELVFALTYLLLSLLLLLLTSRSHCFKIHRRKIVFDIINTSFLLIISAIFLVFIASFYPLMAYVPRLDIARYFGLVQQIMRTPELFYSTYPWFNFYEAVFFALGKPTLEIFQTSLALSSFIMILAFYAMASIYLKKVDQRLPIIATLFWSIFGGFSWFLLLKETLQVNKPFFDLLVSVDDASYIDISIPRVWFWFRGMILGFTLLFVLLYLLRRRNISATYFRLTYSILIVSLALFHISELVLLVAVLSALSFFAPYLDLRLKDAVVSSIMGLLATVLISFSLYYNTNAMASIPYYAMLELILPLSFSYISLRSNWKGINVFRKPAKFIIYAIMVVYVAGTMFWLADPSFSMSMVYETLFVPWFLYPVRLGLVGFLGLIGILVARKHSNDTAVLFALMFFSTLVFARLLSYVNVYFFTTGFFEARFIQASLLPSASILAALGIKPLMTKIRSLRHLTVRRALIITLTSSLIVIVGTTSTFLAYDYTIESSKRYALGDEELSSVNFLSNALYDNPRSPVLTFTDRSMVEVEFCGPIFVVERLHLPAWSSTTPEIPLLLFRGDPQFTAPYIYLHERDKDAITKRFPTGILLNEIIPMFPSIYQNEKVELYKIPEGSPALMNSSTALLMPFDYQEEAKTILPVFLSLSLGNYEYTTMLDSDMSALKKDIIIIPTDSTPVVVDQLLKGSKTSSNKTLIVFNSIGYGSTSRELFSGEAIEKGTVEDDETLPNEVKVNLIEGVENLSLSFDLYLAPIEAKEGVEVLGWFSGQEEKIPFVGRKDMEGVEVIYVNIYPLISHIRAHSEDEALTLLGAILNLVELGLKKFSTADFKLQDLLLFKDATFEGTITIRASSVTFPLMENTQLKLEGKPEIYNVHSILLSGVDNVTVMTNYGQIGQGKGFYTQLTLGNSTFELNGQEIEVEANLENGEVLGLKGLSTLKFSTEKSISIYARTPTLSITGNTTFQEAYGLHKIYEQLRTSGHKLQLNGDISLTILASDAYTIAKDLSWRGSVQLEPPILLWDELESLKTSIPWFAFAAIIFITGYWIFESHPESLKIITRCARAYGARFANEFSCFFR